ncbi:MAG: methionyl-tRNA formyltransferase [Bacteroidales bacterium]
MPGKFFPSVVFYGTPEFAVPSLRILLDNNIPLKAVVTAPDKPSGRGLTLQSSPVKQFALEKGIKVMQPTSLKDEVFLGELSDLNPDLQIVVAFRKLPEAVWKLPVLGTFNLHASLLPDYRGAAPINWSLINGDGETGLTTFLINEDIDAGSLLLSEKVIINPDDTAGDLHDRMKITGAGLVLQTTQILAGGSFEPKVQPSTLPDGRKPRPAPKIFREDCRINWLKSATEVNNLIRGLSPYPGAFAELLTEDGSVLILKILLAEPVNIPDAGEPGSIMTDNRTYWYISCHGGWIKIIMAQLPGRKLLSVREILNGFTINPVWRFLV